MKRGIEVPFDSVENAQQYVKLLAETVAEAKRDVDHEIVLATNQGSKSVPALRIVGYSLAKLQRYLSVTGRTLNDLRSLRRILLNERPSARNPQENPMADNLREPPAAHEPKENPVANNLQERPADHGTKHRQSSRTRALTGRLSTEPPPLRQKPAVAVS